MAELKDARAKRAERAERAVKALLGKRGLTRLETLEKVGRTKWSAGTILAVSSSVGVWAYTVGRWELMGMCVLVGMAMTLALRMADTVVRLVSVLDGAGEAVEQAERVTRKVLEKMPRRERDRLLEEMETEVERPREPAMPGVLSELFNEDE